MFNTLKYAKMLEAAGFSRNQAETSIRILVEIMEDKLATKQDIRDLAAATKLDIAELAATTKLDIAELRAETKQEIQEFRAEMKHEIQGVKDEVRGLSLSNKADLIQLKHDLTLKMGAMLSASVALVAAIHKFM